MKSVILVLATVLFCAVNTADGIKCESSAHTVSKETGEVTDGIVKEVDCPETESCVLATYTLAPAYDYGEALIYYNGACGNHRFYGSPDYCNSGEKETCSQTFCSEDLCNAFSKNYSPTTEPSTTEPPTTEPSTTEPPITLFETTVETSTYTSPSSNCPLLVKIEKLILIVQDFMMIYLNVDIAEHGLVIILVGDLTCWKFIISFIFYNKFLVLKIVTLNFLNVVMMMVSVVNHLKNVVTLPTVDVKSVIASVTITRIGHIYKIFGSKIRNYGES